MMTVLTILVPISAFIAFLADAPISGVLLSVLALMLWRAMLNR